MNDSNTQEDVPLAKAVILWNERGDIKVVKHPCECRFRDFRNSTTAAFSYWSELNKTQQLLVLMAEGFHLARQDGVHLNKIHEAFMVIPEFREFCSDQSSWPFLQDPKQRP